MRCPDLQMRSPDGELQGLAGVARDSLLWQYQSSIGRELHAA
jgi:hypothetical protein